MSDRLSAEVIEATRRFWQGCTAESVSPEEAREAVRNVTGLFQLLERWDRAHQSDQAQADKHMPARDDNVNGIEDEDDGVAATG